MLCTAQGKPTLSERCVVDGEIVIVGVGGLDFETLLWRIHPAASRVKLRTKRFRKRSKRKRFALAEGPAGDRARQSPLYSE